MKRKLFKTLLSVVIVAAISLVPAGLPLAAGGGIAAGNAEIKSKDEVIYATLASDGSVGAVYAVNHFAVSKAGTVTDYGDYSSVKNLTDTSPLSQAGGAVTGLASGENFYYQGDMTTGTLPWRFDITYSLDGIEAAPGALAGKAGSLEIHLTTKQNPAVNPVFYENYMLQISLTLDTEKCADITAPGATMASAGKNKVAAYTVMPGTDADFTLSATVRDFTMAGIDITAMPFTLSIELPDTAGMMSDFTQLSDAIAQLNDGVGELKGGAAGLKTGADELTTGSADIKAGLSRLYGNSGQLIQASGQISGALTQIAGSLNGGAPGELDLGSFAQLPGSLSQLADGLYEISGGLTAFRDGFASAYMALDAAIQTIPGATVTEEQLAALYAQTDPGQHAVLDALAANYTAAQTVRGTYSQVKGAFDAAGTTIDTLTASIGTIAAALDDMSGAISGALSQSDMMQQLTQLAAGLAELDKNYAAFHGGLTDYMSGVGAMSSGYAQFHQGLSSFGDGIGAFYDGVAELQDGTAQLSDETAKLPETVQAEIDDMLAQYTGSDFEPVSFTSPNNEKVELVQFVLKCDGIDKPEETKAPAPEETNDTFWDRLLALFK